MESSLRAAISQRTIIADGAMGTMIQEAAPSLQDFENHEGCNEILNVTRPDIIRSIHRRYLEVGVDAVETNTFGANLANLGEYGIADRIYELAFAGACLAREVADEFATSEHPRWVLGSMGPGTKLPTLGHTTYRDLKESYHQAAKGLIDGGADALLIETAQDLLQAKAAVNAARQAIQDSGRDLLLIAQVTIETTGTMLMGSEIGAALNSLGNLGIDLIGLNCATGPAEMSEHLRSLSQSATCGISVMPNAGLPILEKDGARYPLTPKQLAEYLQQFVDEYHVNLVGGCCGTTPEHLKEVVAHLRSHSRDEDKKGSETRSLKFAGVSSLYTFVPFRQDLTYLSVGERTNANGSKAFRDALLADDWQTCIDIAKDQIKEGAHLLDLSVDYVGRDGVRDMRELASRLATTSTLPIMLDSTEPKVIQAGLENLGGRCIVNSVNFEDGDGPDSRFARMMPLVKEHGAAVVALTIDEEGQARTTEWKVRVAIRLITTLVEEWGMRVEDILIDCLTFPIATGQEETRKDGISTLLAIKEIRKIFPEVQTTLGVSNISFGLNPAARVVLNSVFLAEAIDHGLTSAIVHPSRIMPLNRIDETAKKLARDLIYDRREYDSKGNVNYDPLNALLEYFADVKTENTKDARLAELAALPLLPRLRKRIIDGEKNGLQEDLSQALSEGIDPLDIINNHLLEGMKEVGDLFGKGEMQLPFVLQSAEVMKSAVAILEPHLPKTGDSGKGRILLATVKGDVHDIGKNLVDIIVSNNGYTTVNIGIKQTINQIIDAAEEHNVDVIGMSGLLVKSTVIMRENLEELRNRGLDQKWPVILGGAALTRSYVEDDLAREFPGTVRYAKDAFEGLSLMDALMDVKKGKAGAQLPPLRQRRTPNTRLTRSPNTSTERSDVSIKNQLPKSPFFGSKVVKGIALQDYIPYLDERALFVGQWGLQGRRNQYDEMVNNEGRPRLRALLNEAISKGWINASVVYGYFPCYSEGNDLVILHHEGALQGQERYRLTFPRQSRDRRLCISDFFRPKDSGEIDTVAFHVVTMGHEVSSATAELFSKNEYREYLELHGLSVQLTEALAEYWHARIRAELGYDTEDSREIGEILDQGYRGSRYSFGYPACPDLELQVPLCELLQPERIGVTLSEEFQLHPEQSTSAIIVHHPEAKYFNAN